VLGTGAGGQLHTFLLVGWTILALLMGRRYFRHFRHWSEARLSMTHDLVERMVGHRTRLAQEAREHWHDGEDQALEQYLARSGAMDQAALAQAMIPGGWLVLSLLGLAPSSPATAHRRHSP
jgi:ATP-binding cassette, subfamily B, bacterial